MISGIFGNAEKIKNTFRTSRTLRFVEGQHKKHLFCLLLLCSDPRNTYRRATKNDRDTSYNSSFNSVNNWDVEDILGSICTRSEQRLLYRERSKNLPILIMFKELFMHHFTSLRQKTPLRTPKTIARLAIVQGIVPWTIGSPLRTLS